MNYKKIIQSRKLRIRILALLNFVPDRVMVPLQYRIHTGRKLNLRDPKRFTEKLQWYKLFYRDPLMLRCTDKYEVRKVVEEMGCGEMLIPLIGVYGSPQEIDFDGLPPCFVAKTTDGGGGNQVLVVRDKRELGREAFFARLNEWMAAPKVKSAGREWAYENGFPRRIVIEELISDGRHKDIPDYKFYCFDGEPKYCQLIGDRTTGETIDFYDMEWRHMPFRGLNPACGNAPAPASRPENFEQMKQAVRRLAKGFPFVRVDLYDNGENVYFGELTFYPASGLGHFAPDEWDARLGELMAIPESSLRKYRGGA